MRSSLLLLLAGCHPPFWLPPLEGAGAPGGQVLYDDVVDLPLENDFATASFENPAPGTWVQIELDTEDTGEITGLLQPRSGCAVLIVPGYDLYEGGPHNEGFVQLMEDEDHNLGAFGTPGSSIRVRIETLDPPEDAARLCNCEDTRLQCS